MSRPPDGGPGRPAGKTVETTRRHTTASYHYPVSPPPPAHHEQPEAKRQAARRLVSVILPVGPSGPPVAPQARAYQARCRLTVARHPQVKRQAARCYGSAISEYDLLVGGGVISAQRWNTAIVAGDSAFPPGPRARPCRGRPSAVARSMWPLPAGADRSRRGPDRPEPDQISRSTI